MVFRVHRNYWSDPENSSIRMSVRFLPIFLDGILVPTGHPDTMCAHKYFRNENRLTRYKIINRHTHTHNRWSAVSRN